MFCAEPNYCTSLLQSDRSGFSSSKWFHVAHVDASMLLVDSATWTVDDAVLGAHWLRSLEMIKCDFSQLTMISTMENCTYTRGHGPPHLISISWLGYGDQLSSSGCDDVELCY